MRFSGKLAFVALLVACLVAGGATSAVAASAKTAAATKTATKTAQPVVRSRAASATPPLVQGAMSVQIGHDAQSNTTNVLVDVRIDPSVQLPARIRVPVVPGATILWAGEILGGDPNNDPQRSYTLHDGAGGAQYAEFTLTESHTGQVDTGGLPVTVSGSTISTRVEFVQSVPSSTTAFTVRMPAGVSQVSITPPAVAAPESNPAGERLYTLATQALAPGSKSDFTVSFSTAQPAAGSRASNQAPLYVALGIALVVVIAMIAFVLQRSSSGDSEDDAGASEEDVAEQDTGTDEADEFPEELDENTAGESPGDSDPFSDDDPFDSAG